MHLSRLKRSLRASADPSAPRTPVLLLVFLPILLATSSIASPLLAQQAGESDTAAPQSSPSAGLVLAATVSEAITPASSRFITRVIDQAEAERAVLLVISLDTPGGLMDSMRDIVKRMLSSEVPIAVFVSPPGSRAASAGVFITMAAQVAAMAPGTNIGAAHPVNAGGAQMDSTMTEKVTNDAVAYARSIARRRGRNEEWAENSVRKSVSLSSRAAVEENVVDYEVPTVDSLLAVIDGREVETIAGRVVLATRGARVREVGPSFRERALGVISNPNIAYILMLIGIYGIIFELSNPGAILPGVAGAICLILALYSFQSLPLNYAGILLILLGMVMLLLEIKVTSYGALTMGGIAALTLGSLMLVRSPSPFVRISLSVIVPAVVTTVAFFLLVVGAGLRAQRRRRFMGPESLLGATAVARSALTPHGQVIVGGELWNAVSSLPVAAGETVVIDRVEGLRLFVSPTNAK